MSKLDPQSALQQHEQSARAAVGKVEVFVASLHDQSAQLAAEILAWSTSPSPAALPSILEKASKRAGLLAVLESVEETFSADDLLNLKLSGSGSEPLLSNLLKGRQSLLADAAARLVSLRKEYGNATSDDDVERLRTEIDSLESTLFYARAAAAAADTALREFSAGRKTYRETADAIQSIAV